MHGISHMMQKNHNGDTRDGRSDGIVAEKDKQRSNSPFDRPYN